MNYRSLAALGMTILATQLDAQTRFEFNELHMGIEVRIVLYAADEARARSAARATFDRIEALENIMSDYRLESELRRLERRASEWMPVSPELFHILARSMEVAAVTDGAFDPTVGPLVSLWREARRTKQLPSSQKLDSARMLVGWKHISLDSAKRQARLALTGMRLDLGGIAKGYIVQQAVLWLRARGAPRSMVVAGGDIAVGQSPPHQSGWLIAIGDTERVLENMSIATSGPEFQSVEIAGVKYSHVVDPRSGLGVTNGYSATVVAADGAIADALATALTVLGPGHVRRLLERYPTVSAVVQPDDTGRGPRY